MMTNETIGLLNEMLTPEVNYVQSEIELRVVSDLDASVYGVESINHEGLRAWWQAYRKGIYVLRKRENIIGAIGIWPIKKATYNKLIKGKLDEVDLKAKDISGRVANQNYSYWYFADIVLEKQYHKTPEKLALFLMEETLRQWLSEGSLAPRIHVCALGFEDEGIKLLKRFNFQFAEGKPVTSRRGKPAYMRTLTAEEIQQEIDWLSELRNRRSTVAGPPPPTENRFDVFISYRREPDADTALALELKLQSENLRVFRDLSDLRSGRFDKALCDKIANTPNFIVILSPGCLDRCSDKKDWFRREIALALRTKRNIIPIVMDKFEFPNPEDLPSVIRSFSLDKYQRISYSYELFDGVVERIIDCIKR